MSGSDGVVDGPGVGVRGDGPRRQVEDLASPAEGGRPTGVQGPFVLGVDRFGVVAQPVQAGEEGIVWGDEPELVGAAVGAVAGLGVGADSSDKSASGAVDVDTETEPESGLGTGAADLASLERVAVGEVAVGVDVLLEYRTVVSDEVVPTRVAADGVFPSSQGDGPPRAVAIVVGCRVDFVDQHPTKFGEQGVMVHAAEGSVVDHGDRPVPTKGWSRRSRPRAVSA